MFSNFKARASKIGSWSAVWLVPLVALLIGVWLIYDYYSSRGEEIILYSQKADGLEAGKTLIKIRNVEVGKVTSISLSNDLSKVIVKARMSAGTDEFLHEDSSFWVVKPSIGVRGVSGLDTIMSGQYIELYPGKSEKLTRQFDLMDQPRVLNGDEKGTSFVLFSRDKKSSVDVSTPIRFKGYEVGVITSASFSVENRMMQYGAFVYSPFDRLVTENTHFWTNSGFSMKLGSSGMQVQTDTLASIIAGGVSFGVAPDSRPGEKASPGTRFQLYASEDESKVVEYRDPVRYVVRFKSSVSGLMKDAPVEYLGVQIGRVVSVPLETGNGIDFADQGRGDTVPVLIELQADRLNFGSKVTIDEFRKNIAERVTGCGLNATLSTQNYLTGSKRIELVCDSNLAREKRIIGTYREYPTIPTGGLEISDLADDVHQLLGKLNHLDVEGLIDNASRMMKSAKETSDSVRKLTDSLAEIGGNEELQKMPGSINETLKKLGAAADGLTQRAELYSELSSALREFSAVMKETRPAMRKINEQPSSLIFGSSQDEPEPRRPSGNGQK